MCIEGLTILKWLPVTRPDTGQADQAGHLMRLPQPIIGYFDITHFAH